MKRQSRRWAVRLSPVALLVLWATMPTIGQDGPDRPRRQPSPGGIVPLRRRTHRTYGTQNGEWQTYGADLKSTRYSALDQVNASNFNKLEPAFRIKTICSVRAPSTSPDHAADGERRVLLLHGRHPPCGGGSRCPER